MFSKSSLIRYFDLEKINRQEIIFVCLSVIICVFLYFIPTGFEGAKVYEANPVKAEVIETDNSLFHQIGLMKTGEQLLSVKILSGKFRGDTFDSVNHFLGKLDLDKFYKPGDKVFAVLEMDNETVKGARVIDRYRINTTFILLAIFIIFLIFYAGWVGFKAVVSFFFTALVIWKIMLPGYLKYYNPVLFALLIVAVLTAGIIFLVAGFTKKGAVAFLGAFSGILLTCVFSLFFGNFFKIPGEVMPYSETLLYTGFVKLRLSEIFLAGVFVASSGAVMDIAMDVSASMAEITDKKPTITTFELIKSGFTVGRSVIGTMTTTLLLAYSGGYSTLLMIFIAQGVPMQNVLNYQIVSGEILLTVVGSFGLVAVAPLTAVIGGLILKRNFRAA